ncbi:MULTISPECIES: cytochrome P450 [Pseudofrankia]|uniref:cytochrome P450 n=1 Tax=Pseudofrankia TaxID=2994363 RepID=UPI000234DA7B|nr:MULTISPECIES: cytochrome P450 [Pseudofrankia]
MLPTYPFALPTPTDPPTRLTSLDGPVCPVTTPWGGDAYLVTGYAEARKVLSDPAFSLGQVHSAMAPAVEGGQCPSSQNVPNIDPPGHTMLRGLVSSVFSPRRMEHWRVTVAARVDGLLDELRQPAELVSCVGEPLPLAVICETMGLPPQVHADFRGWAEAIVMDDDTRDERWLNAWTGLVTCLRQLIAERRRDPRDDILSELVALFDQQEDLSELGLLTLCVQLLVDGYKVTSNQLCVLLVSLLQDVETYQALVSGPDLVPAAVEELLRLHPHAEPLLRATTRQVDLGGSLLPAGTLVLVDKFAVNRDGRRFADADRLRIDRAGNNHLVFGHGPHRCLGAALARIELQTVVTGLVRRFPHLRLAPEADAVRWSGRLIGGIQEINATW